MFAKAIPRYCRLPRCGTKLAARVAALDGGVTRLHHAELTEELDNFIRACVPNLDAAELLLVLARRPVRSFALAELIRKMGSTEISETVARRYLDQFSACGVVTQTDKRYRFAPADAKARRVGDALEKLYNEKPVTLVRMIYNAKDARIRAFADAFQLKGP